MPCSWLLFLCFFLVVLIYQNLVTDFQYIMMLGTVIPSDDDGAPVCSTSESKCSYFFELCKVLLVCNVSLVECDLLPKFIGLTKFKMQKIVYLYILKIVEPKLDLDSDGISIPLSVMEKCTSACFCHAQCHSLPSRVEELGILF